MNKRILITTLVILAAALITTLFNGKKDSEEWQGQVIGENIYSDTIDLIQIKQGRLTTCLMKQEGVWTIKEKNNFPADPVKLGKLIEQLHLVTLSSKVSSDPEKHASLGVTTGMQNQEESGMLISFSKNGKEIKSMVLGKSRGAGDAEGMYFRYADQLDVFLVKNLERPDADPNEWFPKNLMNIQANEVQYLRISTKDSKMNFALSRENKEAVFKAENKEASELNMDEVLRFVREFETLQIENATPLNETLRSKIANGNTAIVIRTFDGSELTLFISDAEGSAEKMKWFSISDRRVNNSVQMKNTVSLDLAQWAFSSPAFQVDFWVKPFDKLLKK